jgi:hypothetical protein
MTKTGSSTLHDIRILLRHCMKSPLLDALVIPTKIVYYCFFLSLMNIVNTCCCCNQNLIVKTFEIVFFVVTEELLMCVGCRAFLVVLHSTAICSCVHYYY